MIPIKDHNPSRTTPVISYGLIGVNVVVFVVMFSMGQVGLEDFIQTYALIPDEIVSGQNIYTLLTSMFLHGGLGHIFSNMIFLNIFGDNLEDYLGHLRFLGFYLLAGLGGSGLQILTSPGSTVPNLGASGAIAGLMGGYLLLFPRHKIDVLIPFGGWLQRTTVPAVTMLGYWILSQFIYGVGSLGVQGGGVAYFAHIGGFVSGVVLVKVLKSIRD